MTRPLVGALLGARLAELERGLAGLLSCFESEPMPALETMDSSWSFVLRAFEDVRSELGACAVPPAEQRESMEQCARLYAVATGVLARRRAELAQGLATCSAARERLDRLRPDGQSGASCDMRG